MKPAFIFVLLLSSLHQIAKTQVSLKNLYPQNGKYAVGFKHYTCIDSSRTYHRIFDWNNKSIARPIPVSLWYPSEAIASGKQPMTVLNYLQILKAEEEWEHLPDEQILNWFSYSNTPEHQQHLQEKTHAYLQLQAPHKKFPIIIYAPSYQGHSVENFALCEYLAGNGYIVIACPSRGTDNRFMEGATIKDVETQARDIEFLTKEIMRHPNADPEKIAVMGFSFGDLSNILVQTRNHNIKAIVSLDGSVKYQYKTLQQSSFFSIHKVNVPFIHMAQKRIPDSVMKEDKLDSTLNTCFHFYDSLIYSKAYRLQFHQLTHPYFSCSGILFQERDQRQDKSDNEIVASYKWLTRYVHYFLDAHLKNNKEALQILEKIPADSDSLRSIFSINFKLPAQKTFRFEDFNELAAAQGYNNLPQLYHSIIQQHPQFRINESKLNNLGLQLAFNPATSQQGIMVLLLATEIFSTSANLFDSLGEVYLYTRNTEQAIHYFKKSLELDAQNQNAKNRLQQLNNTKHL